MSLDAKAPKALSSEMCVVVEGMAGRRCEGMLFFVDIGSGKLLFVVRANEIDIGRCISMYSVDRAVGQAVYQLSQRYALEGQSVIAAHRAELAVFGSWLWGSDQQCDGADYWAEV